MKKSFMTRALAMGLSLAMAFSMSAATNVTTAAAAAKPAMKSSKMTVKVGQTKGYNAKAATQKAYKITKTKVSKANKDKATITIKSNKKGIKVTGEKAVKSMSVRIYFKNNKTKKTTSVVSKLTVKEVVTKQSIVKAEATGVKTITLTMAKDVASVATPVAITVKKGSATRTFKPSCEGKTITLAMDTKLIAGDYTVSIKNLETEELTATVNVAKNETLTSYDISDELIATKVGVSTSAYFYYSALNQYGEKMVADKPNATCTLGKTEFTNNGSMAGIASDKVASATAEGRINVFDMPDVFSIVGTKGQVTLIDPSGTGVTATKEVTLSAKASAAKAEYVGVYHVGSAKILENIRENDRVRDYELLFKMEDQYGHAVSAGKDLDDVLTISFAGGITKLSAATGQKMIDRVVDGVEYLAYPLDANSKEYAVAGDALLTITNNERGMLLNTAVKVVKDVVIKNVTFTFDNGVYEGQDNEIGYEITDTEGNSITDYATLLNAFDGQANSQDIAVSLKRNKDGSAKFILNPGHDFVKGGNDKTDQNSQPGTFTTYWNKATGGDYYVKTTQCTVYQRRYAKTVQGIDPEQTISFAVGTGKQEIESKKIWLADQYGNTVKDGTMVKTKGGTEADIHIKALTGSGVTSATSPAIAITAVTNDAFEFALVGNKMVITPSATKAGSGVIYMSLRTGTDNKVDPRDDQGHKYAVASSKEYDAKFTINIYDTKEISNETYEVKVKDGWTVTTAEADTFETMKNQLKVYAKVGGNKTQLPESQYVVVANKNNSFSTEDTNKGIDTKTGTVTVRVTTNDKVGNPVYKDVEQTYTLSKAADKIYAVDGTITSPDVSKEVTASAISNGGVNKNVITRSAFLTQFKYKSQYGGTAYTATQYSATTEGALVNGSYWASGDLVYSASLESGMKSHTSVLYPDSKDLAIEFSNADKGEVFVYKITAKATNGTEKSFKLTIKVVGEE